MEPREIALSQARGRIAIGAALVLLPGLAGRGWIGEDSGRRAVKVFTRALGARDMALGLGVVIALDRGAPVRGWLEGSALADAVDFAGTLIAGDALPTNARRGALAIAGGSAVVSGWLARELDDPPAAGETRAPEAAVTGHPPA